MPAFNHSSPFPSSLRLSSAALLFFVWTAGTETSSAYPDALRQKGAQIYKDLCLSCHGPNGEGVKGKYDEALIGTRSLDALAKRIDRTMPEDDPDLCDAEDSMAVAAYIYDAFYSTEAQARNNPERSALSRLTVAQYQNSVMDILDRFRGGNDWKDQNAKGLRATYKKITGMKHEKAFERIDSQVSFDFGGKAPDPEKLNGEGYGIDWTGTIYAPESGIYEFTLKSQNGVRLWLNNHIDPFIDGWVSAGETVREEKKSIYLLGGRVYPIRVEFMTFKEKAASIQLLWKPPHGVREVIPNKVLYQRGQSERMVVTTSFPADDRSDGYERGTTLSKEWDQATTKAAIEVMDHVIKHLDWSARTKPGAPDRKDKLKQFAHAFAEGAFKRPLTDEQKKLFVDVQFEAAATPELAVKRVILLSLKSPRFLYPDLPLNAVPDDYDVATRLSLALWDSVPDSNLLKAAAEKKLRTREDITKQAWRMIGDPRSKQKLHGFFEHWLELERAELASKDAKMFPGFDATMLSDLRESLWMFLDQVVWSKPSDYRQLLQADYLWMNERLAKYYGKHAAGHQYEQIAFGPNERVGIITHPYLLASFAYNKTTSPIHRGVFLTRNVVGMTLKSPPVAVAFEDSKFDPTLTMREKVTELTKDTSCMGCHSVINPLGFTLEHYDAVGRWRTKDNDKDIDATGEFDTDEGKTVQLKGAKDIANYAIQSPSAHRSFIRQLFHHQVKQPAGAYGKDTLENLRRSFEGSQFHIQNLMVQIALTSATHNLPAPPPQPKPVVAENKPANPAPQATAAAPAPKPQQAAPAPAPQPTPKPQPAPATPPASKPAEVAQNQPQKAAPAPAPAKPAEVKAEDKNKPANPPPAAQPKQPPVVAENKPETKPASPAASKPAEPQKPVEQKPATPPAPAPKPQTATASAPATPQNQPSQENKPKPQAPENTPAAQPAKPPEVTQAKQAPATNPAQAKAEDKPQSPPAAPKQQAQAPAAKPAPSAEKPVENAQNPKPAQQPPASTSKPQEVTQNKPVNPAPTPAPAAPKPAPAPAPDANKTAAATPAPNKQVENKPQPEPKKEPAPEPAPKPPAKAENAAADSKPAPQAPAPAENANNTPPANSTPPPAAPKQQAENKQPDTDKPAVVQQ